MGNVIRPILSKVFRRERLFKLLDSMREQPVIWISGPPGSGKTTLVNSYLDARRVPCLWYQVEEADTDPARFFYYMGEAEKRVGGKKRSPLPLLASENLHELPAFTIRYFENLYDRLKPSGAIVLDSFHRIPAESPIHEIILNAVSAIRKGIHFIFVSRSDPPPVLIRLCADHMMEIIGWEKLRLTTEETSEIVRLRSNRVLTGKEIAGLHGASDGWAAGLTLLLGRGRTEDLEIKLAGEFIPQEVFDYFATEIFDRKEEEVKRFLLKISFLSQMSAKMAEELTGLPSANRILSGLFRDNCFTEERLMPEPQYQFHPLMRKFLNAKAKDFFTPEELVQVQQKAGRLSEESGQIEDAVALYRDGKDWDNFTRLITGHGLAFLNQGGFKLLQEGILSVPREILDNNPFLLYWLGACQLPVNSAESFESFQKAFHCFRQRGDLTGSYLAWAGIMRTLTCEQNDWALLGPWVDWLSEQIRTNPHFPSPEVEAGVAVSLAGALLVLRPEYPNLRNWVERSLELSRQVKDVNLSMRIHITAAYWFRWTGDMARCAMICEELERIAQSLSASPVLIILKKWVEASISNLSPAADFDSALRRVNEGLKTAVGTEIGFWNAMLLTQAVVACLNKGDLEEAGEFLKEMYSSIKSTQRVLFCHYHYLSSWYYLLLGDGPRAFADSKTALNLALESGSASREILCRMEMAQILKSEGQTKNAAAQLNLAGESIARCGSQILEFSYLMAKAQFSLDEGEESAGLEFLRQAMALGKKQGYVSMMDWWQAPVMARLCAKALAEGIEVDYVRHFIRKRDLLPENLGRTLGNWPWPLRIYSLGQFHLEKNGKRLIFPGKAPQKALLMLKALVALGGKEVREEQITDLLWPESDGDVAHIAFKTLLSRLRQLLGVRDAIEFQGGKANFNPEICWVDTWAFEDIYSQAKKAWEDRHSPDRTAKAIKLTEGALAIYGGSFLQGYETYDWTSFQRERLRRKFHFLISRLGEHLQEAKKWKEAVEHYHEAIEVDPLPEEFYQNLMICYLQLGKSNEGIAVYRRFRKMISQGMDIVPSRKTISIYQSLLNIQAPSVPPASVQHAT